MESSEMEQRDRTRSRPHLLPGLRRRLRAPLPREGNDGSARRTHRDLHTLQSAGRSHRLRIPRSCARGSVASPGHPQRQDRQLPSVSADAVERESARYLRHARTLRRRGAKHADLRGERSGQIQGHRHHARRAQFRSLSALRRPHVSRRRQGAETNAHANRSGRVWLADHGRTRCGRR